MRKITKRSAAVITAAVVAVGGAGAAWAAWSLNSAVDASSTAGSAAPLSVTGVQVVGTLLPGSTNAVSFTAKNPNNFPVKITGISYGNVTATNGNSGAACSPSNLQSIAGAALPGNLEFNPVNVSGDTQTIVYNNSVRLQPNPDDACQGSTFSFKVNLTVVSNA